MKATVVLFFFLGMNSLLFCINPKDSGIYEDAYMMTNAILKGSQVRAQTGYTIQNLDNQIYHVDDKGLLLLHYVKMQTDRYRYNLNLACRKSQ